VSIFDTQTTRFRYHGLMDEIYIDVQINSTIGDEPPPGSTPWFDALKRVTIILSATIILIVSYVRRILYLQGFGRSLNLKNGDSTDVLASFSGGRTEFMSTILFLLSAVCITLVFLEIKGIIRILLGR